MRFYTETAAYNYAAGQFKSKIKFENFKSERIILLAHNMLQYVCQFALYRLH
jgi:hypothetical protein